MKKCARVHSLATVPQRPVLSHWRVGAGEALYPALHVPTTIEPALAAGQLIKFSLDKAGQLTGSQLD